jgi:MFS family permease
MEKNSPIRFPGSCVVAGTLLSLITMIALHLLRPDYNPLRNFMSEYLVGPFGFLGTAALYILAGTLLMLMIGLWLGVRSSGFLVAACILMGVVIFSLWVSAVFPIDLFPPDGRLPQFTRAGLIHAVAAIPLFVSLIALLFILPCAYKRDEEWRSASHVTLVLGFLTLASFAGFFLAPFYLRGLAQRATVLPVLIWLLLTGLRLRQATAEPFAKPALLFATVVTMATFGTSSVLRISSSFAPLQANPYLYWGLVVLCMATGTFSFRHGIVELQAYLRERKMSQQVMKE